MTFHPGFLTLHHAGGRLLLIDIDLKRKQFLQDLIGGLMKKTIIQPLLAISVLAFFSCTKEKKVIEIHYAPVLYNLDAPDSVERGSDLVYYMFVSVADPDGLGNIDSVFYKVTRPDGSNNPRAYLLRDDGQMGDSVANDGRFTNGIYTFGDTSSQLGDYIFDFQATDNQGDESNHLPQNVHMFLRTR